MLNMFLDLLRNGIPIVQAHGLANLPQSFDGIAPWFIGGNGTSLFYNISNVAYGFEVNVESFLELPRSREMGVLFIDFSPRRLRSDVEPDHCSLTFLDFCIVNIVDRLANSGIGLS